MNVFHQISSTEDQRQYFNIEDVNRRGQGKESTQRTKLKLNNGMNRNRLI
jgi:hypothetical protein